MMIDLMEPHFPVHCFRTDKPASLKLLTVRQKYIKSPKTGAGDLITTTPYVIIPFIVSMFTSITLKILMKIWTTHRLNKENMYVHCLTCNWKHISSFDHNVNLQDHLRGGFQKRFQQANEIYISQFRLVLSQYSS